MFTERVIDVMQSQIIKSFCEALYRSNMISNKEYKKLIKAI